MSENSSAKASVPKVLTKSSVMERSVPSISAAAASALASASSIIDLRLPRYQYVPNVMRIAAMGHGHEPCLHDDRLVPERGHRWCFSWNSDGVMPLMFLKALENDL